MTRRSKLEMYVDVLKVLARNGPLKLTHIMYKANVNCSVLKGFLDFLMEHDLVEERPAGETRVVYAVTQRGVKVLKRFREVKKMMPVGGEPQSQVLHY